SSATTRRYRRLSEVRRALLNAIPAKDALFVRELRLALHKETGPANELPWLLGQDAKRALAALFGIGGLLLFVLLVVDNDESLFQDHIQAGLDVVVIEVLIILVFGLDRHDLNFRVDPCGAHDLVVIVEIVDERDLTELLVVVFEQIRFRQILEVRLVGIGHLEVFHFDGFFQVRFVLGVLAHQCPSSLPSRSAVPRTGAEVAAGWTIRHQCSVAATSGEISSDRPELGPRSRAVGPRTSLGPPFSLARAIRRRDESTGAFSTRLLGPHH